MKLARLAIIYGPPNSNDNVVTQDIIVNDDATADSMRKALAGGFEQGYICMDVPDPTSGEPVASILNLKPVYSILVGEPE